MKKHFFLLSLIGTLIVPLSASAQLRIGQIDSLYANPATRDSLLVAPIPGADSFAYKKATIQLPGSLVAHFIAYLPNLGRADVRSLLNQIRKQNPGSTFDTAKIFTLTPSYLLTKDVYESTGSQQERLTAESNARTQAILIPALRNYPALYLAILQVAYRNKRDAYSKTCEGVKIIMDTVLY